MKKSKFLPKIETFAKREAREKAEENRIKKMVNILGREKQLPKKFQHRIVRTPYDKPETILQKAGYKDIGRGWVLNFKNYRYHAYPYAINIYLHKDLIAGKKHKATKEGLDDEVARLEGLRSRQEIMGEISKYKDEIKRVEEANRKLLRRSLWQKFIRFINRD